MSKTMVIALAGCLMLCCATPMTAQTSPIIDHFNITLGTYLSHQNASIRVDGSGGSPGTPIDFDETFGLDNDAALARGTFEWRFAEKHQVSFGTYRTDREGTRRLTRDIEFDGEIFHVDTLVTGKLTTTFYDVSYTYYPYLRDDRALGVTGSLVTMSVSAGLSSDPGSGDGTTEISRRSSANLPAPGLGVSYRQRFGPHWQLEARGSFLPSITIDKFSAETANMSFGAEYRFLSHYSVGASYEYFRVDAGVDATDVDFAGEFEYKIHGPAAYARFYW